MTYIRINTKTKQAKKFVELIETMPFAEILSELNSTTKSAMDSAKKAAFDNGCIKRTFT